MEQAAYPSPDTKIQTPDVPPIPTTTSLEEPLIEVSSPKQKKHIQPLIIIVCIYGILLYSLVGYLIVRNRNTNQKSLEQVDSVVTPTSDVTPMQEATATESTKNSFSTLKTPITLPLLILSNTSPQRATASANIFTPAFDIPPALQEQLGAYQYDRFTVVGPKNWYAVLNYTNNEGTTIHLYPITPYVFPASAIWVYDGVPGALFNLQEPAKYFSSIRTRWSEFKTDTPVPLPDQNVKITPITPHLIQTVTVGQLFGNLEINSLMFSDAEDHINNKLWNYTYYSVMLPQSEHQLAQELINIFIQQYGLDKK